MYLAHFAGVETKVKLGRFLQIFSTRWYICIPKNQYNVNVNTPLGIFVIWFIQNMFSKLDNTLVLVVGD